jgi:hypothetical protein
MGINRKIESRLAFCGIFSYNAGDPCEGGFRVAEFPLISINDALIGRIQQRKQKTELVNRTGDEIVRQRDIDTDSQVAREDRVRAERQGTDQADADFRALVRQQIAAGDIDRRLLTRLENLDDGAALPRGSLVDIFA